MKRIFKDPFIWISLAALLFLCVYFIRDSGKESSSKVLNEAQMNYLAAERTKVVSERKEGFNRSLESFLALEKQYEPTFGNGKLYFDIGNNFFQLEEYPRALLYYYRAENLRPDDEKVKTHIALAQKKLALSEPPKSSAFEQLLGFHTYHSLPERIQRLSGLIVLTFILLSVYFWFNNRIIYLCTIAVSSLTALQFLSVGYTYLFTRSEGVVIKSNLLYRDAGTYYSTVKSEPLAEGIKVLLLDSASGGKWIKIETNDGTVGYLPEEAVLPILK